MTKQQRIILAQSEDLTVVVEGNRMLVLYKGRTYDPSQDFRCIEGGSNKLWKQKQDEMRERKDGEPSLWERAVAEFESLKQERIAYREKLEAEARQKVEAEGTGDELGDALKTSMFTALAEMTTPRVIEAMKPVLDAHIAETYGVLPKLVRVETEVKTHEVKGFVHEMFTDLLQCVSANVPVFLTGAAGVGKNVVWGQVAEALELKFYVMNAIQHAYQLTGFIDAGGRYHQTQFFTAFTEGGLLVIDEADASVPEAMVVANMAIANRYFDFPTGRFEAHEDFRIVVNANTYGTGADMQYVGRYQLDAATLDRFVMMEMHYDKTIEAAVALGDSDLVDFARSFREACAKCGIQHIVSYRGIDYAAKLSDKLPKATLVKACFTKHLASDDLRQIRGEMKCSPENEYMLALSRM